MRHDDAEHAIVERARRDRIFAVRHARDRRDAGIERRGRDLRAAFERHDAVLHVEEQPVEPGHRHRLGDLDAARHADADAERQLALFELLAGNIADGGWHRGSPWLIGLRIENGLFRPDRHPPRGNARPRPGLAPATMARDIAWRYRLRDG